MKIINRSPFGRKYLKKMVNFVQKFTYQNGTKVTIEFTYDTKITTVGCAYILDDARHYKVDIVIGGKSRFPRFDMYRKSAGGITLHNREEELIMYIAHELRHVDTFAQWVTPKQPEVDAERFGHTVLGYWRLKQEKKGLS